ncbi:MAG: aldo/keto reductase [Pseudomonadota bacterium]
MNPTIPSVTDSKPSSQSKSSPKFSRFIFGAWRLCDLPDEANPEAVAKKISAAMEHGITTFDHADIYGDYQCEEMFGRASSFHSIARDRIQLISKCGIKLHSKMRPSHGLKSYDTTAAHVISSVENSLKMLKTDYLDALLIHRPDPLMDADELAGAFSTLKKQGKVLSFGVSNFMPSQVPLLQSKMSDPLISNQIEVSLLQTESFYNGQLDQCQEMGMIPMGWSPLAGGRLFVQTDARTQKLRETLMVMAAKYKVPSFETIAFAWLLKHPAKIFPVLGTGKTNRIEAAIAALDIHLERDDWYQILKAAVGHDVA